MNIPEGVYYEAMEAFRKLDEHDPERSHREAELILLGVMRSIGCPQIANAFEDTRRRIGFWYS